MRVPPLLLSFLKFGGLSGLGWLADACILIALVSLFGVAPFVANLISSSIAALSVFLISRELIFSKASGRTTLRIAGYFAYVFALICVASVAVQMITVWTREFAQAQHLVLSSAVVTGIAKVLVTPPQLVLNFLVSRFMSERNIGEPRVVTG